MKKSSVIKISYCEKQGKFLCPKSQKQADKNVETFHQTGLFEGRVSQDLCTTGRGFLSVLRMERNFFLPCTMLYNTYELESNITFLFSLHVSST